MRYYWEALFSVEYFPYWEFTMLMILLLNLSMLWRLHRIENKMDIQESINGILDDLHILNKNLNDALDYIEEDK
jgi:hypothetical protein|tara:strand:+ start:230 stop:451 length:222 start_codon:yes stop_codon:yes gene_type:complete